eukprot:TRINITY_DN112991_c0_g1_i1.p1 TRINITY_DN112991_c0_g1~~TRINITY_DN112991_c0_g1_i1.p1  ORF type:complete len:108 (-),score=26.74 TRINITY_DN112991_c0_g1_i1:378-701(-)
MAFVAEDGAAAFKHEVEWAAQAEAVEAGAAFVEAEAKANVLSKLKAWDSDDDGKISKECYSCSRASKQVLEMQLLMFGGSFRRRQRRHVGLRGVSRVVAEVRCATVN